MTETEAMTTLEKVLAIAEDVYWFDWSNNDTDAVHALEQLRLALAELKKESTDNTEAMKQFIRWAIQEGSWHGCDLDGGEIQDKALELGLIFETRYDPKVHGQADYADPAGSWFEFAEWLK